MNPETPQAPLDYLNQIAPQMAKKTIFSNKKMLIIGGLGALAVLIMLIAGISSLFNKVDQTEQLAARLLTTQAIVENAIPKIKNSQLRTFNGNIKIYLTNTIRDITPILANSKITIDALSAGTTSAESGDATLAALEDARLNAIYDRTYAREMSYQIDKVLTLMNQIYKSTSNEELKTFLDGAYKNLEPTQKQFADFNAANG
ncbi:MAG: hypothetical protein WCI79_00820 [Candidatus Saccharibacteria bacterium]